MRCLLSVIVAFAVALLPAAAHAQLVQRPQRPLRGLFGGGPAVDPNRTHEELTLTGTFIGGFDDWIAPQQIIGPVALGQPQESGYTGTGEASIRYWIGRTARYFSVDGRATTSAFSGVDVDPTTGANVIVRAATDLGRMHRVEGFFNGSYDPMLVFGVSGPSTSTASDAAFVPGAQSGFVDQRSWASSANIALEHRWTRRQTTRVAAGQSQRNYLDDFVFDSAAQTAELQHRWAFQRAVGAEGSYQYSDSHYDARGVQTPLRTQDIQFGLSYHRRLSASRQLSLDGGVGTILAQTIRPLDRTRLEYRTPGAHGAVRMDIGRTWAIGLDYHRAVNVLQGVTLHAFGTDSVTLRTDGGIGDRIELAISAAFANGRSGFANGPGRFENYTGTAQLRYAASRWCAAMVSYDYFYYRLRDIQDLRPGFPSEYDRNALRVGLTIWLPLYGTADTTRGRD